MKANWLIGGGLVLALGVGLGSCSDSDSATGQGGTGATSAGSGGGGSGGTGGTGGTGGSGGSGATGGTGATGGSGGIGGTGGGGGQAATGGQAGQAGGGGQQCTDMGDACTICLLADCEDEYCECYLNPECVALAACIQPCGSDPDCVQACWTDHPDGIAELFIMADCAAAQCSVECPFGNPLDPCSMCMFTLCEAESEACFAEPDCVAAIECAQGCPPGDIDCWETCAASGGDEAEAVLECVLDECSTECGL